MSIIAIQLFKDSKKNKRFFYFLILTFIFALIYCLFSNDEFGGLNEIQLLIDRNKKDETSKMLEKQNKKSVNNLLERFLVRLYYSFTVVATVGFGDIYPASLRLKVITIIQFMFILYFLL